MDQDRPFAELRTFRPGAVLAIEGQRGGVLYILSQGTLEVLRGDTVVTRLTERGSLVGEIAMLLERPHTASVQAVTEVEVFVIEDALRALQSRPEWMLQIARLLAQRVVATTNALVESRRTVPEEVFVLPESAVAQLGDPMV